MKLPKSVHNGLSYVGIVIAVLASIVFGFLLVLHTVSGGQEAPYAGLVMFVGVPALLLIGLLLIPIGMVLERRRRRTGARAEPVWPIWDLNDARYRNAFLIFTVGSLFVLFLTVFSSFKAYEATESVAFCGRTCHSVMEPEYTAYGNSPHARVRCVDCHVGPGAEWYVRSKLSGAYQVYAVLFDKHPRPIPAPIESLRPAQETCEQCHWPQQFFGGQQKRFVHFLPDETNTRWEIDLLIKTGGGRRNGGQAEGIHWHMNIANRVEYIASDEQRQKIPWVRITNTETGASTEYTSTDAPLPPEEIARAEKRVMDCMDCHNRPTHIFRAPNSSVNLALASGRIDPALPAIKATGIKLLAAEYETATAALAAIADGVETFYRDQYPDVLARQRPAINRAIAELQNIYRGNFFPAMKVRWDVYPDNVGHLNFIGCDRCHDGAHKSADGKVIRNECITCHVIMAQGKAGALAYATGPEGLAFEHPVEIGGAWEVMPCSSCHTGEAP